MEYKKISAGDIGYFKSVIGESFVFADSASIEKYSHDETDGVSFAPEVVLKPISATGNKRHCLNIAISK